MSNWNYDNNHGPGPPEQQFYEQQGATVPNVTYYNQAHGSKPKNDLNFSQRPIATRSGGGSNGNTDNATGLPVDISHSKLTATAKEFTPSTVFFNNNKTGAVRKEYNKKHSNYDGKSSFRKQYEPTAGYEGAGAELDGKRRYGNHKKYTEQNVGGDSEPNQQHGESYSNRPKYYETDNRSRNVVADVDPNTHSGSYTNNASRQKYYEHDNRARNFNSDNSRPRNYSNDVYKSRTHNNAADSSNNDVKSKYFDTSDAAGSSANHVGNQSRPKYFGSGRTMYSYRDDRPSNVTSDRGRDHPNARDGSYSIGKQHKNGRGGAYSQQRGNERAGRGNDRYGKMGEVGQSGHGNKENWRSRQEVPEKDRKRASKIDERRRDLEKRNSSSPSGSLLASHSASTDDVSASTKQPPTTITITAGSHRERLEEQLRRRQLECLVCCERLLDAEAVWSCGQCYHILHLACIREWARSSKLDTGWRCPACQNVVLDVPKAYLCFCGKQINPPPPTSPNLLPHACSDTCSRLSTTSSTLPSPCPHPCTLPCHPGPCPDCERAVTRRCGCGATAPQVRCCSRVALVCRAVCGKVLHCGQHKCEGKCHVGECEECKEVIRQECHCGKQGRKLACTAATHGLTSYACPDTCGRSLACGNHRCAAPCHPGDCAPCPKTPDLVTRCPCNQTALAAARESCLDAVPCCEKVCGRPMSCGQPNAPHCCQSVCHEGACPPCKLTTMVRCRCGHMDQEMTCKELTTRADDARCKKKCTKKRQCCKHNCNQLCCIDADHPCPLPCSRMLGCGTHRCPLLCHRGVCPRCDRLTFDELTCECGAQVLFPPIACGTRPPPCQRVCSRVRTCGHEPLHACHSGECPPCTVLTRRLCHGGHEFRPAIPCHTEAFSCGMACGKPMACGQHKCVQVCHTGDCPHPCTQPCQTARPACGHACSKPCHPDTAVCPPAVCRLPVQVTCECGNRTAARTCDDLLAEYERAEMLRVGARVAEQMRNAQGGGSAAAGAAGMDGEEDGSGGDEAAGEKKGGGGVRTLKILDCTEDCKLLERNRRLAIGLQIRNPDLSSKLMPRYSDSLKDWARKNPPFVRSVHRMLTQLVELAQQSKQRSRQHSFEVMNRPRRQFVHEYSDHFGCETASYDDEPNRNVIATAYRDKSWLPSYSLMDIVQRESGQRKVPGPVLGPAAATSGTAVILTAGRANSQSQASVTAATAQPGAVAPAVVDYFNYEGPNT